MKLKDINAKYLGSQSNKLRRVPIIEQYLCEIIDCQEIRRLVRYMTLDPLADFALDYNNKLVQQPDLQDSLMEVALHDIVSNGTDAVALDNHMFTNEVMDSSR